LAYREYDNNWYPQPDYWFKIPEYCPADGCLGVFVTYAASKIRIYICVQCGSTFEVTDWDLRDVKWRSAYIAKRKKQEQARERKNPRTRRKTRERIYCLPVPYTEPYDPYPIGRVQKTPQIIRGDPHLLFRRKHIPYYVDRHSLGFRCVQPEIPVTAVFKPTGWTSQMWPRLPPPTGN
jgi:hypothetical protein